MTTRPPTLMTCADVRTLFVDFFQKKGHVIVPSGPVVPQHDPSLLFTSAGMVPFKDYFTGVQPRPFPSAVSCQKCVRAGGKHNDLEQVGHTKRHHTFFEMLGNFSFGDYFKENAIAYAWEFLTEVLKIDKARLWVTVYHTDEQAVQLWKKIAGLGDERIIRIATSDNFWSAGETGPCGPCSEIFYDHGPHLFGGLPGTPDEDGDRYVELWNLVFMQFDQTGPDQRIALPAPSIDTGMGLERVSAVMQGVCDNFETDIFRAIIQQSKSFCARANDPSHEISHRVIADHLRSSSFLLAEGVLPSNEGRGYVVRRILRRALRHVHYLGAGSGHLALLLPVLIEKMGQAYPELIRAQELIASVLSQEGLRFEELLRKGLHLMDGWLAQASKGDIFPGKQAFTLYDTFGFPLDLTQDILAEKGYVLDEAGFHEHMTMQRELSRASWAGSGASLKSPIWQEFNRRHGETEFLGYAHLKATSTIALLLDGEQETERLSQDAKGSILTKETPFYAESGGQKGDTGLIVGPNGTAMVLDSVKKGHLVVHQVHVTQGFFQAHECVSMLVDEEQRKKTAIHHSATHLLQAALRLVLGKHVMQKGSLVGPDRLRFDFSHSGPVAWDALCAIEQTINGWVGDNIPVCTDIMSQDDALSRGAMAFFGERYGDQVRVVSMDGASIELCGGTHVTRTGDMGFFKIISESGVASGIRRIEALAGMPALDMVQTWHNQLRHLANRLKTSIPEVLEKVDVLLQPPAVAKIRTFDIAACKKDVIGSRTVWHAFIPGESANNLRSRFIKLQKTLTSGIIVLTTVEEDKTSIILGLTPDLIQYDASKLLNAALASFGVMGGGRQDVSQGGGKNLPDHDGLIDHIKSTLAPLLALDS
jgi:alanyl-tRNA synthetase